MSGYRACDICCNPIMDGRPLMLSVVSCVCTACDRYLLTGREGEGVARMPRVGAP